MGSAITAIGTSFGENTLSDSDLRARFGNPAMERVAAVSGILERRIADPGTCSSDLAYRAASLLFEKGLDRNYDALIFATQTPDYLMPSNACLLQERLALPRSCAAFDINLGCSQFVYALATARAWIDSKLARRILVLCADTPSKLIHPLDRSAVSLFGDAAAACSIEACDENFLTDFTFGTDGRGFEDLICPASGMRRHPLKEEDFAEYTDESGNIRSAANLFMDGVKIFAFAHRAIPQSMREILKRNSLNTDSIDLFVFHQAGEKIISSCAQKLGISMNKVWFKMHDVGNCGGASVPIALADAAEAGRLKAGMTVAACAFGVGLSWGCALLKWRDGFLSACDADFTKSPRKPPSQSAADKFSL